LSRGGDKFKNQKLKIKMTAKNVKVISYLFEFWFVILPFDV
jgi:hypothetical protein